MDPEKIMNGISKELLAALEVMAKAKTPDEKLKYSEIVKNLCESLGVLLDLTGDILPFDDYKDEDDESVPF